MSNSPQTFICEVRQIIESNYKGMVIFDQETNKQIVYRFNINHISKERAEHFHNFLLNLRTLQHKPLLFDGDLVGLIELTGTVMHEHENVVYLNGANDAVAWKVYKPYNVQVDPTPEFPFNTSEDTMSFLI